MHIYVHILNFQGVNVKAPWKGSPDATNTISGTSMAAPHVVSVLYVDYNESTSCLVEISVPGQALGWFPLGFLEHKLHNSIAVTDPIVNCHRGIEVLWPKYHGSCKTRFDIALSCKNLVK